MSDKMNHPERVTLTDEEREWLRDSRTIGRVNYFEAVERILAAREQALREEIATSRRLLEYALNLRMYGDGKDETQRDWDVQCEHFLRGETR